MLSKKYYKEFAYMFAKAEQNDFTLTQFQEMFITYLSDENARFDRTRFREYIAKTIQGFQS